MARAASRRTLLLVQHKPFSFLSPSTSPRGNKRFAIDLLTQRNSASAAPWVERSAAGSSTPSLDPRDVPGLVCIGRLDADSTGVMLWTTDGALATRVMSPASHVEKEYLVRVTGHEGWGASRRDRAVRSMSSGMEIDGVPLLPATVRWLNESQLQITLTEGKHRQARAMCDMAGLQVAGLKRVRIGGVRLGGLRIGQWAALPESVHRSLWAEATGQARPEPLASASGERGKKQDGGGRGSGQQRDGVTGRASAPRPATAERRGTQKVPPVPGRILHEVVI